MAFSWIATLALMQAGAPPAAAAAPPPNDYALEQNWLCRPGRRDACTIERDATQVLADGSVAVQTFTAAADPKVDCFYVYPT